MSLSMRTLLISFFVIFHIAKSALAQEVTSCGNDVCDIDEFSTTCSADCENLELETFRNTSNGILGVMFHVKALRDIRIKSLAFYTEKVGPNLVRAYSGQYNYAHKHWHDIYYNSSMYSLGPDNVTELGDLDVYIRAGKSKSFYIIAKNNVMYDTGTSKEALFAQSNELQIYEGFGVPNYWSGRISPVVFKGKIKYDVVPSSADKSMFANNYWYFMFPVCLALIF